MIEYIRDNWMAIIAIYLAVHKLLVSIRDVLDKTPQTDDNWFEKIVSIMGKLATYLITGSRPK